MKHFALFSALIFVLATSAQAQDAAAPIEPLDFSTERLGGEREAPRRSTQRALIPAGLLYASFDTDGNYSVSRSELNAGISRSFIKADKNSNAVLSLVELANWREAVLGSRDVLPGNRQFDKNFDSQILATEFELTLSGLFDGFDRNKNGALEFSEMTKAVTQGRGRDRERNAQRERPIGGQGRGGGRPPRGG